MKPDLVVSHDDTRKCFEAFVDGLRCELDYNIERGVMCIHHTGVPPSLEGRGIAAELVRVALGWARDQNLKVRPICSYVAVYLRRHPEWNDLHA